MVDFLGRFEQLETDFKQVAQKLGRPADLSLPVINKSSHKHYSDYYTAETRAIVERVYRRDIEAFGYGFEG